MLQRTLIAMALVLMLCILILHLHAFKEPSQASSNSSSCASNNPLSSENTSHFSYSFHDAWCRHMSARYKDQELAHTQPVDERSGQLTNSPFRALSGSYFRVFSSDYSCTFGLTRARFGTRGVEWDRISPPTKQIGICVLKKCRGAALRNLRRSQPTMTLAPPFDASASPYLELMHVWNLHSFFVQRSDQMDFFRICNAWMHWILGLITISTSIAAIITSLISFVYFSCVICTAFRAASFPRGFDAVINSPVSREWFALHLRGLVVTFPRGSVPILAFPFSLV